MKKFYCLILAIIICICFTSCKKAEIKENTTESPLKEVSTVYDDQDNLIQQILYNELTDEYIMKEFVYAPTDEGDFICIDQRTTILNSKKEANKTQSPTLKIYYNNNLLDGPITIIDNEFAKISIVKYLADDNWWEFGYELKVVNKTNKVISILIDDAYIMDISCKPLFSIDHIDAGNTAYFTLAWDKETLERCYIPYIDNVEFMVRIYDNENWKVPALTGEKILIKQ